MDIEIRKLSPDLAEDYVRFFDVTPHDDKSDRAELPCYCITWRSDDTYKGDGDHWFATREERRARALQYIKDGKMQGYLAFQGNEVVGWCNATADCLGGVDYLRSIYPIENCGRENKVKSIFCFMIAPQAQRMGVATKLVQRVCMDAAAEGFDFVEAYTNREYAPLDFSGPLAMYENCGFDISAERDGKVVVRKALKQAIL